MKGRMIIIGGGGHAKVLIGIIKRLNYDLAGYTDIENKGPILNIPFIGNDSDLQVIYNRGVTLACMGISYLAGNILSPARDNLIKKINGIGFIFPVIISNNAIINNPKSIGVGSVIMDNSIVNPDAVIGNYCVLNTNSIVEHDCVLKEGVQIGPGSVLSGGVSIGKNTFIGANSTIINGISITNDVIIGAGSVVIRDCSESGTYVGNPARRIK